MLSLRAAAVGRTYAFTFSDRLAGPNCQSVKSKGSLSGRPRVLTIGLSDVLGESVFKIYPKPSLVPGPPSRSPGRVG